MARTGRPASRWTNGWTGSNGWMIIRDARGGDAPSESVGWVQTIIVGIQRCQGGQGVGVERRVGRRYPASDDAENRIRLVARNIGPRGTNDKRRMGET